ncbi:uncharacterized protein LOC143150977 isoform X2 [Ptiloglossa arizonensis]|uniref:uncharacterized protein LOC143150977 isoform X2 n=1 Tax=Ptiloglossa arizonensis TaxID=3350558 RepID=UPI003FA0419A
MNFARRASPTILILIHWHVSIALAELRIDSDRFEALTEVLTTVLSTCEKPKLNTVGVVSSPETSIQWTKESSRTVSRINANDLGKLEEFSRTTEQDQDFLAFALVASSVDRLKIVAETLRRTKWWNPTALYILLDDRSARTGCGNAHRFLETAWEHDLLSSTFLCIDDDNSYRMYTYNPFTPWAPKAWREATPNVTKYKEHPWTLLTQTFDQDRTTCEDLDFVKTRTLEGYPVKAVGLNNPPSLALDLSRSGSTELAGIDGTVASLVWSKLNVSLRLTRIANNTRHHEFLALVSTGVYDVLLNVRYLFNEPNTTMVYPHVNSGISVLTRYPENESAHAKIFRFMNPVFVLGVAVVCAGTVIFLAVFVGRGATDACLEVLRMALSNSMLRFPERSPSRMYLITVFLLFILTTSTFQSNLSSLLTSSTPKLPVDSIDTLKRSRFAIYAYRGYKNAVFDDVLFGRVKTVDHWDCSEYVQKFENAACAADRVDLLGIAFEKNLRLSKHRISTLYSGYAVRPNWPLRNRVGSLLMHASQGGLIRYWWDRTMSRYTRNWSKADGDAKRKGYEVMKLENLAFAFYVLIIGLGASSMLLFLEILTPRFKAFFHKYRNVTIQRVKLKTR